MTIIDEFKKFAVKGNVIDLAVGVIVGGAFGKIVTSLVNDIVMPPIGFLISGVNFKDLTITIKEASLNGAGQVLYPGITINYGIFLQSLLDFLIISWAIFLAIQAINRLRREETQKPPEAEEIKTSEEKLLEEIRDLLKKERK